MRLYGSMLAAFLAEGCLAHPAPAPRKFESAAWKQASRNGLDKTRCNMLESLLSEHELIGMTKAEVAGLLGEQDDSGYFRAWDLRYYMGQEHGFFAIDSEWLVIKFENGKVVRYAVVTD